MTSLFLRKIISLSRYIPSGTTTKARANRWRKGGGGQSNFYQYYPTSRSKSPWVRGYLGYAWPIKFSKKNPPRTGHSYSNPLSIFVLLLGNYFWMFSLFQISIFQILGSVGHVKQLIKLVSWSAFSKVLSIQDILIQA